MNSLTEQVQQAEEKAHETQSKVLPRLRREEEALAQTREQVEAGYRARHRALSEERDRDRELLREASSSSQAAQSEAEDTPLVADCTIPEGLERALFGALGEDLFASWQEETQNIETLKDHLNSWRAWKTLPPPAASSPPLPAGVVSFAALFTNAPPPLRERLACIGLVSSRREGEKLHPMLARGQRVVTRDGACWRWDGLATRAELAAALEQRFHAFLQKEQRKQALAKSEADLARLQHEYERQAAEIARKLVETRERVQAVLDEQARQGKALQELRKRMRTAETLAREQERDRASEQQLSLSLEDARNKERSAEQGLRQLDERERLAAEQAELGRRRESLLEEQGGLLAERQREQAAIVHARDEEQARLQSEKRLRALTERHRQLLQRSVESLRALENEAATWDARPLRDQKSLDEQRALHRRASLEHRAHKDDLEKASGCLARLREQHRRCSATNAEVEKEAVRLQTQAEPLPLERQRLSTRAQEEMDCSLSDLRRRYDLDDAFLAENVEVQKAAKRSTQDKRARLGEINFTAKQELELITEEQEQTERQHTDVAQALEKLHLSVRKLEEEASGKLVRVQQETGVRFAALIERLFGGGEAKLFFSDPEAPISSGLEIRIALPGKRLKSLSVLSGGEQALVAIALVLAVFSVTGGGFCILDEVDAALDDTNVARFCDLLEDIARQHDTRFLVITHHRHTMSRALRLYGVAMPEPGCSRIVSVALEEAVKLARPAAE